MIKIAAIFAMTIAVGTLSAHADKTCLVNKFQYYNKGGYIAKNFTIRNKTSDDNRGGNVGLSETKTLVIKEQAGIKEGDAVWLQYYIADGMDVFITCHKEGTTLVFDSALGNTWNYKSKGTTMDGNRCRFGDNECIKP